MMDAQVVVNALPVSFLGRLLQFLVPYRRNVIRENINQVFGDSLNSKQKTHLILAYYSHLALSIIEIIKLRFIRESSVAAMAEVRGHEHLLRVAAKSRGVLVLTGHFGNWEVAPIAGILNFKQFQGKFHFIRRRLGSQFIERILFRRYYSAGLDVIPKKNSLTKVCDALEKNHAVVFVLDQHASIANRDGIAVEFFGKKAGTYRSLASLSRHTGLPVIPAAGYRLANGRHVLEFYEPIQWREYPNVHESIYQNTLTYNQALEKIILAHPEQWLWLHKRWKL